MLIAWLLAVALGAAIGYAVAQRGARRYWQRTLDQQQALLRAELDAGKEQVQQLRQDNADLRYQLGEASKARHYAERRLAESRGDKAP
jgi:hypothetical protein